MDLEVVNVSAPSGRTMSWLQETKMKRVCQGGGSHQMSPLVINTSCLDAPCIFGIKSQHSSLTSRPLKLVPVQSPSGPFSFPVHSPRGHFLLVLLCQRDEEAADSAGVPAACSPACREGGTECSLLCDVSSSPLGMKPISLADHKLLKNSSADLYLSKIALSAFSLILYTQ